MKTPAGRECKFYYEDFHRGRNLRECRLLSRSEGKAAWKPRDCANCPTPDILWANASEHLALRASIKQGILGLGRHVDIGVSCRKHLIDIDDPFVGCVECASERSGLAGMVNREPQP